MQGTGISDGIIVVISDIIRENSSIKKLVIGESKIRKFVKFLVEQLEILVSERNCRLLGDSLALNTTLEVLEFLNPGAQLLERGYEFLSQGIKLNTILKKIDGLNSDLGRNLIENSLSFYNCVVAIDVGNSSSRIAYCMENEKIIVIPTNENDGQFLTCVSFYEKERLFGKSAKNLESINSENTIHSVKNLLGSDWKCDILFKGKKESLSAIEITAMFLGELKDAAEKQIGKKIWKVVLTCPCSFNQQQRKDLTTAASIAGLTVLRIINETSAAALAYGFYHREESDDDLKSLVVDVGYLNTNIAVCDIDSGVCEIISTGICSVGGKNLDERLLKYCRKKYPSTLTSKAMLRLLNACEKEKIKLSKSQISHILVEDFCDGSDFNMSITRSEFDDLNLIEFQKIIDCIEATLKQKTIPKQNIKKVILSGKSTRIPKIQSMIAEYFGKQSIDSFICCFNNIDATLQGAAIQASILSGTNGFKDSLLLESTYLPLIAKDTAGQNITLLTKDRMIPSKLNTEMSTVSRNSSVSIDIFEGDCQIATIGVKNLPSNKEFKFIITAEITATYDINLSIKESNGLGNSYVNFTVGNVNPEILQRMRRRFMVMKLNQMRVIELSNKRSEFESFLYDLRDSSSDEQLKIIDQTIAWFENNLELTIEEMEKKQKEIQIMF